MAQHLELADALRRNIDAMRQHQAARVANAPLADRVAGRITCFAGSMRFVLLHLLLFGGWIAINTGMIPGLPPFDPTLVVLAMAASVEAIFLSTFVLISQNRMAAAAEARAGLDLHVSLLAEHEITRLVALTMRIAERLGVPLDDGALADVVKDVEPTQVLDVLEEEHDDQPS